jgi:hypothetical protein
MRILLAVALIMAVPSVATAANEKSSDRGSSSPTRAATSNRPAYLQHQQVGHIIPQTPGISGTPDPTLGGSRRIPPLPEFHQRMGIASPSARVHRPVARAGPATAPAAADETVRDLTDKWNDLPRHARGLW